MTGYPTTSLADDLELALAEVEERATDAPFRHTDLWGAASRLMRCEDLEVVADSGAGTGKSFSVLSKANLTAERYPGSRQLFCRQTRKSMNETILPMWEAKVLWPGHPAITGTATYEHRDTYRYPNGSIVTLIGLEHIDRVLSAEYDRIYVFQGEETTLESHEKLITRLRHGATPYHQIVHDVNPAQASHWLNRRPEERICVACFDPEGDELPRQILMRPGEPCSVCGGMESRARMTRIRYRHHDNPRWYDWRAKRWTDEGRVYIGVTLEALTGVRRARLRDHQWVSAEGLVWPEYDPARHLVSGDLVTDERGELVRGSRGEAYLQLTEPRKRVALRWCFASVDWGYSAPGCMQLWGVDPGGVMYRVREIYRRGERGDWWAEQVERWHKRYELRQIVCDPAEPDRIDQFNARLGYDGGRDVGGIAIGANNAVQMGLDTVGDAFARGLIFLVRDANEAVDHELRERGQPWRWESELESYVLTKTEGMPERQRLKVELRGEPDPTCHDHACAAARYSCVWRFGKDLSGPDTTPRFPPGSVGEMLGWGEVMDRSKEGVQPWR